MTQPTALLHHVVFAIGLERLDKAAEYLTAIGFCFYAFDHEELRLAIRLDWDRGFELISPLADAPTDAGTAADFLARHGDGLFSVVVRTPDCGAPSTRRRDMAPSLIFASMSRATVSRSPK
jgi:hypothetical protein